MASYSPRSKAHSPQASTQEASRSDVTQSKRQNATAPQEIFSEIATQFDRMSDLMSLGMHRLWKRYCTDLTAARPGQRILDLGGGTGDLALRAAKRVGSEGKVVLVDLSREMLQIAQERASQKANGRFQEWVDNIDFIQANAESLPFPDDHFDTCITSFALRVTEHPQAVLESAFRVLKPGGRLLVLEFSQPEREWLGTFYRQYSQRLLPRIGKLLAQNAEAYRYLANSIQQHPDQRTLKHQMREAGFEPVDHINLSGGLVAIHRGFKP
ncbi:Ubiquinone/menaquinone biosynthesis methyltransferase [gamma proteobacterium HdN1]|nr:Ubiquinone/menaquinone biosynthesis methyltransferase [gamma proteobacterium HdN1]